MTASGTDRCAGRSKGIATVELAIVLPWLIILLFGILEMGLMFSSWLHLKTTAREGARAAAVGATPAEIYTRMAAVGGALDTSELSATLEYRQYVAGGSWGAWTTLGSDGYNNTAPAASHVRVTLSYNHKLAIPGLFRRLADDPEQATKTLQAQVTMRRE